MLWVLVRSASSYLLIGCFFSVQTYWYFSYFSSKTFHMLWVLMRSVSARRLSCVPTTCFPGVIKKIFTWYLLSLISRPMPHIGFRGEVSLFCFILAFRCFQQSFSHIAMVWMWQGAQCSLSAASLKYHTPDTWQDIPPSHIIPGLWKFWNLNLSSQWRQRH